MVFVTDIVAVNFAERTVVMNFLACVLATFVECAVVAMDSSECVAEVESLAVIAVVVMKSLVVDCVADRVVEVANFAADFDEVMNAVDKVVGAANYVGGAAVVTSVDRVVRVANSAADVAVTNVAECVVQTANAVLVLVIVVAIAFENVDVAVDTVDTASIGSCSAIRIAHRDG